MGGRLGWGALSEPALVLLAAAPIAVVLALMLGRRWGSTRAGPVGWALALVVAYSAFGADARLLAYSQAKGILLSLFVLYIVWAALALYRVVDEAGALLAISAAVARMTADPAIQLLVLAWVFASFLQGVTGFGVPVAVVAPLLVGLGFPAVTSVVATSIGSAWAVTFGSLGSAFFAMLAVTGQDGAALAPASAVLLGACAILCGLMTAWAGGGAPGVRHTLPAVAVIGSAMAVTQFALATHGVWSLAAFGGGCAGLAAAAGVARMGRYRGGEGEARRVDEVRRDVVAVTRDGDAAPRRGDGMTQRGDPLTLRAASTMSPAEAFLAYATLVVVVLAAGTIGPLGELLDRVEIGVAFPATQTALGWQNAAGPGRALSLFGHPGALIVYACLLTFAVYRRRGRYRDGAAGRIIRDTARGARAPTVAIVFLVGMAAAMNEAGMTMAMAAGLASGVGAAFPIASPFIGVLGAFITGSNTNANVLFAPLQVQTAHLLGLNTAVIMAAQNVGGAVGSVFAPAKVVVGISTVGLVGGEGAVLRRTLVYGLVVVAVCAAMVAGWVAVGG